MTRQPETPTQSFILRGVLIAALFASTANIQAQTPTQCAEIFSRAQKNFVAKNYAGAALSFESLARQCADAALVKAALTNAAIAYRGNKETKNAARMFQQLTSRFPGSPEAFDAHYFLATAALRRFDYEEAARGLLAVSEAPDGHPHKSAALLRASHLLILLDRRDEAGPLIDKYLALYPDAAEGPALLFELAEGYDDPRDAQKKSALLDRIHADHATDPRHASWVIKANIERAYLSERDDPTTAKHFFARAVAHHRAFGVTGQPSEDVAEALFMLAELHRRGQTRPPIDVTNDATLENSFEANLALANISAQAYQDPQILQSSRWGVAAMFMSFRVYQDVAESLSSVQCPPHLDVDACGDFSALKNALISETHTSVEAQYLSLLEVTIARKLKTPWTDQIRDALHRINPQKYPAAGRHIPARAAHIFSR